MIFLAVLALLAFMVGAWRPSTPQITLAAHLPSSHPLTEVQAAYQRAYNKEHANWLGNTSTDPFYQSPPNASLYEPGQVIKFEKVTQVTLANYKIPPGLSLYRLLYQSTDMDDKPVPASAFVLLPYTRSPRRTSGPIGLVAWAHGTSGIERQCAPSNQRDLYYEYEGPFSIALKGYAVVAPDYAGQGSDTTFHYLAGPSHAADVQYSVAAARQVFPRSLITYEWVVVGHSEGGLTAWATNEREVTRPIGGFLGAVSIAPALQNLHIIRHGIATGGLGKSLFYSSYTLSTIARLDTSVDVTKYFSTVGLERTGLAATACYDTAEVVFANLTFEDVFKDPSWVNSSWAIAWEDRTAVGGDKPIAKPLLLIEGLGDTAVYPVIPETVFANHCARQKESQVHLSRYPRMGHDAVAYVSQLEYFAWIDDRFEGVSASPGCTNVTLDMVSSDRPDPDFEHTLLLQV